MHTRRRIDWRLLGSACGCLVVASLVPGGTTGPETPVPVREEELGTKDAAAPMFHLEDVASPDGGRVAWKTPQGRSWQVVVNGEPHGPAFDDVRNLTFSHDGQHIAYAARRDGLWRIVRDGTEQETAYEDVSGVLFAGDGRRLASTVKQGGQWLIVVDGEPVSGPYDEIAMVVFAGDLDQLVHTAKRAKKWVVVVNGREHDLEFDDIEAVFVAQAGKRVAYAARRGAGIKAAWGRAKWHVVVDGAEGPAFGILGGLVMSRDGRRVGYGAIREDRAGDGRIVVDGIEGPGFGGGGASSGSYRKAGYFQRLWPLVHSVGGPVFSPDGERVAYAAQRGRRDAVVIVDGEPGDQYEAIISPPVFSRDGKRLAYVVVEKGAPVLIVDGQRSGAGDAETDFVSSLVFSPGGDRVAWVGVRGGVWFEGGHTSRARRRAYVDGVPGPEFNVPALLNVRFSPDGRHWAYEVHGLREGGALVVVDGSPAKRYGRVFTGTLSFQGQSLSYIAQSRGTFYRVTHGLAGQTD
jgi:hypothetical protein